MQAPDGARQGGKAARPPVPRLGPQPPLLQTASPRASTLFTQDPPTPRS